MKLMITGATGYIGHGLAMAAAGKGWTTHILVRDPSSVLVPIHPNIKIYKGDITDKTSVLNAMTGCDSVIHTAAFTKEGEESNPAFEKVNVMGTQNVLEAAFILNIKKLVFTGSCSIYGPSGELPISEIDYHAVKPSTQYAKSKLLAEKLIKSYCDKGLFCVTVCPSRIYGPGNLTSGNPITRLIKQVYNYRVAFFPATTKIKGNYVFIDDVINGHFLALEKGLKGEKYFLSGENITYKKFFYTIRQLSGKNILLIPVHKWLLKIITSPCRVVFKLIDAKPRVSLKLIDRIWENRVFSNEKAISHLGYTVTGLDEGLAKTISFLNKGYDSSALTIKEVSSRIPKSN